jgi:hypothetical protein
MIKTHFALILQSNLVLGIFLEEMLANYWNMKFSHTYDGWYVFESINRTSQKIDFRN